MSSRPKRRLRGKTGCFIAIVATGVALVSPGQAADWTVAPDGDDNQPGTADQPFGTIAHAVAGAANGDVIHLRGGTYRLMDESTDAIHITLDGATESSFLTIQAYEDEEPILLGSLSTEGQTWEDAGGGLYRLDAAFLFRDPTGMFAGDQRIEHKMKDVAGTRSHADIADLVNPGEWTKADDAGLGCPGDNTGCFKIITYRAVRISHSNCKGMQIGYFLSGDSGDKAAVQAAAAK